MIFIGFLFLERYSKRDDIFRKYNRLECFMMISAIFFMTTLSLLSISPKQINKNKKP